MAAFPATLEQFLTASYGSPTTNAKNSFEFGTRDRQTLKSDFVLNLTIKCDKTGLNTFETFYYDTLNGGVDSFTSGALKMGSMNVDSFKFKGKPQVSATTYNSFTISLAIIPTDDNNRYNSILNCPNLPLAYQIVSDTLLPCN